MDSDEVGDIAKKAAIGLGSASVLLGAVPVLPGVVGLYLIGAKDVVEEYIY